MFRNSTAALLLAFASGFLGPALHAAPPPSSGALAAPAAPASGEVLVVKVKSPIHPVSAELIEDAITEADRRGAAALVVELDTAGGLLSSTRDITTAILGARTPVVVYVAPGGAQAASAGFFILMSADLAAMAPGTNAGAAHPVADGGRDIPGVLGKKVEQDAAANIRSLAVRNGRNVQLAEAAVLESRSYTAEEALKEKLIDVVAPDLPALVRALDGRTVKRGSDLLTLRTARAPVTRFAVSPLRGLLGVLADPNVTYLLLGLGWLGLLFELMHPGAVLPGVVGAICLVLGLYGLSVLPVNYAGLALIFLAVVFFILEIKVTSYGMLVVAGVVCLVVGSLMLFKSPEPALAGQRGIDRHARGLLPAGGRLPGADVAARPSAAGAQRARGDAARDRHRPLAPRSPRQGLRPWRDLGCGGGGVGGAGRRGGAGRGDGGAQSHPGGTPPPGFGRLS